MPVTDTSRKVKSVIRRRQEDGKWICAAPYGYIVNKQQQFEVVPVEADVIRRIYRLYIDGWGYKRIANALTDEGVPTPRMSERERKVAEGEDYRRSVKNAWSIVTVQGILDNDFYIGTLRQGKYQRAKINGRDVKRDEVEQIVIENHHQPIIDYRTFATVRALREKRAKYNYRGVKINDNVYSGFLECGDCGAPMFALGRRDLKPAYTCGTYHRRGTAGCTTHHIRVDKLDELVKLYVKKVRDNSAEMLAKLNAELAREPEDVVETERSAANIEDVLLDAQEELKATKRQRVRDIMRHPENEAVLEETYDELEADLMRRIEGLQNQLEHVTDKRNTIIRANRAAKTAMEVFDDILTKPHLEKQDLELIIERIYVYEDHVEIKLKADIDTLLRKGEYPLENENDEGGGEGGASGSGGAEPVSVVQSATHHADKVLSANIVSDGDPLEIYTDKGGEVIFKKYSPVGELAGFASQICEALHRSTDAGGGGLRPRRGDSRRGRREARAAGKAAQPRARAAYGAAPRLPARERRKGPAGGLRRRALVRGSGRPGAQPGRPARLRALRPARLRARGRAGIQARPDRRGLPRRPDGGLSREPRSPPQAPKRPV